MATLLTNYIIFIYDQTALCLESFFVNVIIWSDRVGMQSDLDLYYV